MIAEHSLTTSEPLRRLSNILKVEVKRGENTKIFEENRRKFKIEKNGRKLYYNTPAELSLTPVAYVG